MSKAAVKNQEKFEFSKDTLKKAEKILKKYPENRHFSAVMPLLDIVQRQNGGWLSRACIEAVGDYLNMPYIRVQEVATFYEQFHTDEVGKHVVWVCRTTPCWLRGSDEVLSACKSSLGIDIGETTEDKNFTLKEMECLGACVNAPILWVNDDFYEDMDGKSTEKVLDSLKKGKPLPIGSLKGRQCSAPEGQKAPKEAK